MKRNGTFKIEKGIPCRDLRRGKTVNDYPFAEMDVGDSFLLPTDLHKPSAYGVAYRENQAAALGGRTKRFKVRKAADGYRCWRVA